MWDQPKEGENASNRSVLAKFQVEGGDKSERSRDEWERETELLLPI